MKQITSIVLFLFVSVMAFAQTARVQIIHNSPAPIVDIFVNEDKLINNFLFRDATPFIDVPAGVELNIGVAPKDNDGAQDAIANFPVTFADGGTYVVIASGVVGGSPAFGLSVYDMGSEIADNDDNIGLLFFHGSPDAPTVDITLGGSPIFDDVSFGEFQGYLNVPADATYEVDVTPGNDNSTVVASYEIDLDYWDGKTAVIFASGFLGGDEPGFEPWVALSSGSSFPLDAIDNTPPPPPTPTARVQIIHNSPAPIVDIFVNEDKLINNFLFRDATPFIDVPAGVELNIGVAPKDNDGAQDAIANFPVTFADGGTYVVIASGVVGDSPAFGLSVYDMGSEVADNDDNIGLLFFHGSPDAPTVDITLGGSPIFDDVSFGEFQGYLNVPADATYEVDVTPGDDNSTVVASYEIDLDYWDGKTAVIFASGFLGGNEPGFEPWVALSSGSSFPLDAIDNTPPPPPTPTARVQIIHNSPAPIVDIFVNEDKLINNFLFRDATPFIDVPAGVELNIGVAPKDNDGAQDAIANFPVTLEEGETYVVIASGIVGGSPAFGLSVYPLGSEVADNEDNIGLLFSHGSPDAPTVDITLGGSPIFDDVSFGEFQGYLNVPADATYEVDVTPGDDNSTVVASYKIDLDYWDGKTAVIFASGFLGGNEPGFEPWVALSSGSSFPLESASGFTGGNPNGLMINNTTEVVEIFSFQPNPANENINLTVATEENMPVQVMISNMLGQVVKTFDFGLQDYKTFQTNIDISDLDGGTYFISIPVSTGTVSKKLMIGK